jgi:hypothetical protein
MDVTGPVSLISIMTLRQLSRILIVNILLLFCLVEIISFLYISVKKPYLRKFEFVPTYLKFSMQDEYEPVAKSVLNPRVIDSTLPWGIWHVPDRKSRHRTNCFDVIMKFNHYGARGPEPKTDDTQNVIFLGDSFTEGFGLSEEETIPAQFSRMSGRPAINLGVSRSGSTQQSLLYRHFADSFRHSRVFMLIHLENDLTDNDYMQHDTVTRYYKPYRRDLLHPEQITYRGHPDSSTMNSKLFQQKMNIFSRILIKRGLISHMNSDNYTLFGRIVRLTYTRRIWEIYLNFREAQKQTDKVPAMLAWRQQDLRILAYDMEQVMDIAEKHGAKVTFINLPGQQLLSRLERHPENLEDYLDLEDRLKRQAGRNGHEFRSYFNYMHPRRSGNEQIFFKCDGHYNANGARMVAAFLSTDLTPESHVNRAIGKTVKNTGTRAASQYVADNN